ncbi:MAG: hypothetical protein GXP30_09365 [Verrucomicrobia bacterium]|nr:hypothetical protein [Verrucomicrobiota bacterium]
MNTILPPKAVFRSITHAILVGNSWSGAWIGNPYLRQHTRILARMFRQENLWTRRLQEPCLQLLPLVESKTTLFTQVDHKTLNVVPVLVRLAEYRDCWIRDPDTWQPNGQLQPRALLMSLIHHLLNRYDLPSFCDGAWFINGPLRHIERAWYCHLAQGGNIRHFPEWVPQLSRQASSAFLAAPDHLSMREAVRYGQVMSISHDEITAAHILGTRIGLNFSHDAVWLPFLAMFASSNRSLKQMDIIIDYLWAHCELYGTKSVRLRGRTIDALLRSSEKFFHNIIRQSDCKDVDIFSASERTKLLHFHADQWEPMQDIIPFEKCSGGWHWQMVELKRQRELQEEAHDMQHCVSSYGGWCHRGLISIFSLRSRKMENDELDRDVTLEVDCQKRELLQVKAWRNRRPSVLTRKMVLHWCELNRIKPGAFSMW